MIQRGAGGKGYETKWEIEMLFLVIGCVERFD